MKLREKKKISPLMKILIGIEVLAVVALLVLCAYKENVPIIKHLFNGDAPDVILDAGHGGYDIGAMNGNTMEKDITLEMSKEIGKVLEANGYKVAYIREDDEVDWANNESDDLKYRVKTINESGAKLCVSIHVNSQENTNGAYGYEIWGKLKKQEVFQLSKYILDRVGTLGYSQNRGMKDQDLSPLYILENSHLPTVLFEVGFINNAQDMEYMRDGEARRLFCEKTAQGIMDSLKDMEKAEK